MCSMFNEEHRLRSASYNGLNKEVLCITYHVYDLFKEAVYADTFARVLCHCVVIGAVIFNTLRLRQNGRCFADDTFKRIFLNENVRISITISLKFVPKGAIINNPALVQIMAWRRLDNKPFSEPMMVSLLTNICVDRPQWVNPAGCAPFLERDILHAGSNINNSWPCIIRSIL